MNTLRQDAHEYLSMRRHLGFKLREAGKALLDFVSFMEQQGATYVTTALALAWAQQPANVQPAHSARRLSYVRGFARYRCASDPRTQIPSPGLLPFQPKRARPYLYSDEEINSLYQVIEEEVGPLAADGGYLGDDIYGNLPQTSWQKLTRMFLNP